MQEHIAQQLEIGESFEVERGVVVERRSFFTTAAALFAAANLPGLARASKLDPRRDVLGYDDFLREVLPIAKHLVTDTSLRGQDLYLHAVAACAVKLGDVPVPEMRANGKGTFIGANDGGDPFVVLHWRMEPGSKIGVHPHIYGNVCTLGLEGEVRISNYEVVGARDYDAKEPFVVRRTVDQWLTTGAINLVNLERNYMHGFVAGPAGARGLDITTRIREKRPTPSLVIAEPIDVELSTFAARWAE